MSRMRNMRDATGLPLKLSVQKARDWLRAEPGEKAKLARTENVPLESSAMEVGDFPRVLEQVVSAVRTRQQAKSWWQRFKRRL